MSDLHAIADFCLVPVGTGETSVAIHIAQCQRILQKSGLKYKLHACGTNIEGPWNQVMQAIHDCHAAVHTAGVLRIQTDIRIGTRIDRPAQGFEHKVKRVEEILAGDQA